MSFGKYGIPKFGDDEEFPLTPGEIDCLRKHFSVQVVYPELLFFRLVSVYLLKGRMTNAFGALDKFFFRYPAFRAKSYRQYLLLS